MVQLIIDGIVMRTRSVFKGMLDGMLSRSRYLQALRDQFDGWRPVGREKFDNIQRSQWGAIKNRTHYDIRPPTGRKELINTPPRHAHLVWSYEMHRRLGWLHR